MKKCIEFLLSSLVKMKIKYYASFLTILRQLLNYRRKIRAKDGVKIQGNIPDEKHHFPTT